MDKYEDDMLQLRYTKQQVHSCTSSMNSTLVAPNYLQCKSSPNYSPKFINQLQSRVGEEGTAKYFLNIHNLCFFIKQCKSKVEEQSLLENREDREGEA
ncbi:unnamed protein product [Camellia sinensis]